MTRALVVLWCLLLAACGRSDTPIYAYSHLRDALASILPAGDLVGVMPCAILRTTGRYEWFESVPLDQCVRMRAPQRLRGIWLDQHKGSRFYEGLKSISDFEAVVRRNSPNSWDDEWLGWNPRVTEPGHARGGARLVEIDFVGRRTRYDGRYGWGGERRAVMVERLLSARTVYQSAVPYLDDAILARGSGSLHSR